MGRGENSFGKLIKQARQVLDLTQEDLADCVGCSTTTIQKLELAKRRPSKQMALRLAECLRIPSEERETFVEFARGERDAYRPPLHLVSYSVTSSTPPAATPNNLPAPLTRLIGREVDIEVACGYLQNPDVRLLTFTGVPGVGKTHLALDVAARLLPRFRGGVFLVELASIDKPQLVAPTVAIALGCKDIGVGSHLDWLKQHIRDERMLLVLDNFEQILDAAPVVVDLLGASTALKVLVTSREELHAKGEQRLPLQPLDVPDLALLHDPVYIKGILSCPSVELFVQRARAVDPGFALTEANGGIIAAICARLEGLPLAIELAAARIKMLTPEDLYSRLDQRLKVLTGGSRYLPARLQTLRGAIDWSYRLLSPGEQTLFACLSVFAGGATLQAIEAICSAQGDLPSALDEVGSLVDKNLLRRVMSRSRFAMLEMVREYALERLQESGSAEATKRAHARFFLELAEEADLKAWGPKEGSSLDRLEEEHDNLRAALQWSLSKESESEGIEIALRLVIALSRFWEIRGYISEGRERIAAVLSNPATGLRELRGLRAWALLQAEALAFWQSDYSAIHVAKVLEEALATFRELGDKTGIACAVIGLGNLSREQGEYETSALLCEQALSICRELGDTHGAIVSLVLLGWAEMRSGLYSQATAHLEDALALARQLQIPNRIAFALSALGEAMVRQGDHESAVACLEESLAIRRVMGYSWGTAATLGTLGWAAFRQGDLRRASETLMESLILRIQLMDRGGAAWCLEKLIDLEAAAGRPLLGARLLGAARALRDSSHTEVNIADQPDFERAVNVVRSQLSEQAFADAYELGEAMSLEQIAAYAQIASERFRI